MRLKESRSPLPHVHRCQSNRCPMMPDEPAEITLFLSGDVMTGRGIDQILPHPSRPHLFEPYVRSALDYVRLAEEAGARLEMPVDFGYVWGDALTELARVAPVARIVNLETAVTTSEDAMPGKGIHYRMSPRNVPCLEAVGLDCCILANNHVMDWGKRGLLETLDVLKASGIASAGAGRDADEAAAPAVLSFPQGRVLVFAWALPDCGVPHGWASGPGRAGVNLLGDLSQASVEIAARSVLATRRPGDLVVVSLHWGGNWGYDVSPEERAFAHRLVEAGAADIVHGHSSHHLKGVEVYRGKLVLYGCGDLLNDYEGIDGYEHYRAGLGLMYFPSLEAATGRLKRLSMLPTVIRNLRINRAPPEDARWIADLLTREGKALGTRATLDPGGRLLLAWS